MPARRGLAAGSDVPQIQGDDGANSTVVRVVDAKATLDVTPVVCTMSAETFNTTAFYVNSTLAAGLPADPRGARTWAPYARTPANASSVCVGAGQRLHALADTHAGSRGHGRTRSNFTPASAPASNVAVANASAIPGFQPLSTLEAYVSNTVLQAPTLRTLESALENATVSPRARAQ